mmetsp:Transcript_107750/g.303582  ORF Transcript_107750/g.303582 Transcript_107750/m.303582 type:complete len:304 (+) Transcript_107750:113-1024(+)|eukprot:CAMPEP_0117482322 /NCGR_PEP_ID=MMETSP0784-20121206/13359_1 /TAXON_ID=39447 /ORGANISM="" /LENGTH=303 /DNA_ID=CAMNT_0005276813 /DNA_START=94 /DNA_END=1005 /DNA_ORIENTATION=+
MAAGDPLLEPLLACNSEMPILYHTDSSYYSSIVRLALEEKGVEWRSREVDIHGRLEQLQDWYMKISPGACVPTLVHKGVAVPESLDIIRYIDATFDTGIGLTPPDPVTKLEMESCIKAASEFDVEGMTMGYAADWNFLFKIVGTRVIGGTIPKLAKMKMVHPDLAEVVDRKIAQNKKRIADIFGPPNGFQRGLASFSLCLDAISAQLDKSGGPFVCGKQYTLADVLFTAALARGNWIRPGRDEIAARPCVAEYWKTLQERPSCRPDIVMTTFRVPAKVKQKILPRLGLLMTAIGVAITWKMVH